MCVCVCAFHVGARVKPASAQVDKQKTALRWGTSIEISEFKSRIECTNPIRNGIFFGLLQGVWVFR